MPGDTQPNDHFDVPAATLPVRRRVRIDQPACDWPRHQGAWSRSGRGAGAAGVRAQAQGSARPCPACDWCIWPRGRGRGRAVVVTRAQLPLPRPASIPACDWCPRPRGQDLRGRCARSGHVSPGATSAAPGPSPGAPPCHRHGRLPSAAARTSPGAEEPAQAAVPTEPCDNTTYKNLQHHDYNTFTFLDLNLELSKFRMPQPSSGRESPRH
nr:NADH dehydrogenase [ubiquinone] flavoprotein 3, mitochondrial isoform X3 [Equus caballus]